MPCFVQFFYNIFILTDLHCIFGHRSGHGHNVDFLESLLPQPGDSGVLIGVQLSGKKNHRKGIKICVCNSRNQIRCTRSAGGISAGTFFSRLGISAGSKRSALLIVAGMTSGIGIFLNGIYQMGDHGSLISEEIMNPFSLKKFHNIICYFHLVCLSLFPVFFHFLFQLHISGFLQHIHKNMLQFLVRNKNLIRFHALHRCLCIPGKHLLKSRIVFILI